MTPQLTPKSPERAALEAVLEALDIPHAATAGDEEIRREILRMRAEEAVVTLRSVLGETPDIEWSVVYLRERLAEHPATGYRTWDERVAELDGAR